MSSGFLKPAAAILLSAVSMLSLVPAGAQEPTALDGATRAKFVRELKEAWRAALEAEGAGDYDKALERLGHGVVLERQLGLDPSDDFATTLAKIADVHEAREDFVEAEKVRREVLEMNIKLHSGEHWQVADARRAAANVQKLAALSAAQRKRLREAKEFNTVTDQLYRAGKFAPAAAKAEVASAILKQVLGEQHPDYAASLNNLADLYRSQGDYARAEPLFRKALEIDKKVLGEQHPGYATDLNNLAVLYYSQGDYARAEPLYRQALEIDKQVLGEQHPGYATDLNNLAVFYKSQGDYARAEPLYRQALAIRKQVLGEQHPDYATSLNNLAVFYKSQGDYARAEPLYRQASEIEKQVLGELHPDYATGLDNLGMLYRDEGDYARAEPLFRQALAIRKQVLGEQHRDYGQSLNNLGMLYRSQGDYARAEPLFRQALAIRKQVLGEQHRDYGQSLNNLAVLYYSQGDYARAEPLWRRAVEINKQALGEQHPDYATDLANLALLYYSQGDYARAEPLYRQALAILKQVLGEQHPQYAEGLSNLGAMLLLMDQPQAAEPLLRQASEIALTNLAATANVQSERGQLAMNQSVRFHLDTYLTLAAQDGSLNETAYGAVLAWKGAVFVRQHQLHLAASRPELSETFTQWQAVSNQLATRMSATPSPKQAEAWRAEIARLTEAKERLESDLAGRSAEFRTLQTRVTPAMLRQSLPASTALVDLLEYWHSSPPKEKPGKPVFERRLVAFVVRSTGQVKLIFLGPVAPLALTIEAWRAVTLAGGNPAGPGAKLRQLVWDKLANDLDGVETVLISPDGVTATMPWGALPGKDPQKYLIEELPIAVIAVPQLLPTLLSATPVNESDGKGPGSLLVLGDVDYDATDEGPVSEDPNLLVALDRRPAVGVTERGAGEPFKPLAGTGQELDAIGKTFAGRFPTEQVDSLRRQHATEAIFRNSAGQHRWLHLATHGFFAPASVTKNLDQAAEMLRRESALGGQTAALVNPGLLSGLAMTGANNRPQPGHDDGIFTALEVVSMDLSHVEMAVLSACETGLGQSAGGEGLLGLQRAFQVSGAKTTVASLWKVPDEATKQLMTRFYENLWNKKQPMSRLEALREAQLWVLREGHAHGADRGLDPVKGAPATKTPANDTRLAPRFWAAFVLSGDWR